MATYFFETITPQQAATFTSTDTLVASYPSENPGRMLVLQGAETWLQSLTTGKIISAAGFAGESVIFPHGNLELGTSGADSRTAGTGDDALYGFLGDDVLEGGIGADTIVGGQGADTVSGGAGADTFIFNYSLGVTDASTSENALDRILDWNQADTIRLTLPSDTPYVATSTNYTEGTAADYGSALALANSAFSGGSIFFMSVQVGGDVVVFVQRADLTTADLAIKLVGVTLDSIDYRNLSDTGALGPQTLTGGANSDTLSGAGGDDSITGADGADTLSGLDGADTLAGGAGSDTLSGGAGVDTADLSDATLGFSADLEAGGSIVTRTGDDDRLGGIENLIAGNFADTITGSSVANLLEGRAGNDDLRGADGADTLNGQDGADTLSGGTGNDVLDGQDGADTLSGGTGNDVLEGGADNDRLIGGAGGDLFSGGAGADVLVIGAGESGISIAGLDRVSGWDSADRFELPLAPGATDYLEISGAGNYEAALSLANAQIGSAAANFVVVQLGNDLVVFVDSKQNNGLADDGIVLIGRTLADIDATRFSANPGPDGTTGTSGNDTLVGGSVTVSGGDGDDHITTGAIGLGQTGNDTLVSYGPATLDGGDGNDSVVGASYSEFLYGGAGADTLTSGANTSGYEGNDRLDGGSGNDSITTFGGGDTLVGGDGDDAFAVREWLPFFNGIYTVDGGAGVDRLDYTGVGFQYIVGDYRGLTLSLTGTGGRDAVTGVEWLVGSNHNDILLGGTGAETLQGAGGDDEIRGGGGGDSLDGGLGFDTVSYVDVTGPISLNMATGVVQGSGWAGSISTVERVVAGANADSLTGDGQANSLLGGGGADVLDGGAGDDTLVGEAGADSLTGGAGVDLFQIATGHSGVVAGQTDVITDWSSNDRLLMAAQAAAGFSYVEVSAASYASATSLANSLITAGSVNYVAVQVGGDVVLFVDSADDNGVADDAVILSGRTLADISTANFAMGAPITPPTPPSGTTGTTGTSGDDNLINRGPRTTVTGFAGNDTLFSGSADTLEGGAGNDVLVGNGGIMASYLHATGGVWVDLNISGPQVVGGGEGIDTLFDISGLIGGAFNDTLVAVAGGSPYRFSYISGGGGADSIVGSYAQTETLLGGEGSDTIVGGEYSSIEGGAGGDSISGGGIFGSINGDDGDDTIDTLGRAMGGRGSDTISAVNATRAVPLNGGLGDDKLVGSSFGDFLNGGSGANTILAGAGDDTIYMTDTQGGDSGAPGSGSIDGGSGVDALRYDGASPATVNLATGVTTSSGATLTVTGVEVVLGSTAGDSIAGSSGAETLSGGGGADTLDGGAGDDLLMGYQEFLAGPDRGDVVRGGGGADSIIGGEAADSLSGDAGADTIAGMDGGDTIDGGAGIDTVDLRGLGSVVIAALGPNEFTATGVVLTEFGDGVLLNVENLTGGYSDDFLVGDDGGNVLRGESGDDTLIGRGGGDTLTGGAGDDYFVFGPGNSGVTEGQLDTITDWSTGDRLIFATAATAGTYLETTAANYAAALTLANAEIASGARNYVAVAVGTDVILFADTASDDGSAEDAIILRGRILADIDAPMIIAPPVVAPEVPEEEEETGPPPSSGGGGGGGGGGPPPSGGGGGGGGGGGEIFPTPQELGTGGDDVRELLGGQFSYDGGGGNDMITAGPADNLLFGGDGDDTVSAGAGSDTVVGGAGRSYLRGDEGEDRLIGGSDFDDINGNMGEDTINGGEGDDWVVGGKDADLIFGDQGQDLVYGNIGNDVLSGGSDNDIVRGGQGNDICRGGEGDDYVSGDRGSDTMDGGAGADILHTFSEAGLDYVINFSASEGDRVQVDPGTIYTVSQVGGDVVIDMGGDNRMILQNVELSSLPAGWIFGA